MRNFFLFNSFPFDISKSASFLNTWYFFSSTNTRVCWACQYRCRPIRVVLNLQRDHQIHNKWTAGFIQQNAQPHCRLCPSHLNISCNIAFSCKKFSSELAKGDHWQGQLEPDTTPSLIGMDLVCVLGPLRGFIFYPVRFIWLILGLSPMDAQRPGLAWPNIFSIKGICNSQMGCAWFQALGPTVQAISGAHF